MSFNHFNSWPTPLHESSECSFLVHFPDLTSLKDERLDPLHYVSQAEMRSEGEILTVISGVYAGICGGGSSTTSNQSRGEGVEPST